MAYHRANFVIYLYLHLNVFHRGNFTFFLTGYKVNFSDQKKAENLKLARTTSKSLSTRHA